MVTHLWFVSVCSTELVHSIYHLALGIGLVLLILHSLWCTSVYFDLSLGTDFSTAILWYKQWPPPIHLRGPTVMDDLYEVWVVPLLFLHVSAHLQPLNWYHNWQQQLKGSKHWGLYSAPLIPAGIQWNEIWQDGLLFFALSFQWNLGIPELRPECSVEFTGMEWNPVVWHSLFACCTPVNK